MSNSNGGGFSAWNNYLDTDNRAGDYRVGLGIGCNYDIDRGNGLDSGCIAGHGLGKGRGIRFSLSTGGGLPDHLIHGDGTGENACDT